MTHRHLFLLLGSLENEAVRTECLPLPIEVDEIAEALGAATSAGGRICGAVVQVESEGRPSGFEVAAAVWAAARGRVSPLTDFVLAPGEDVGPIVAAVCEVVVAEGLAAGNGLTGGSPMSGCN